MPAASSAKDSVAWVWVELARAFLDAVFEGVVELTELGRHAKLFGQHRAA